MVGLDGLELLPHDPEQPAFQVSELQQFRSHRGDMLEVGAVVERLYQMLLRSEIVVRVAERDARTRGDRPHGCSLVAALAKQLERGFEDLRFRGGRFLSGIHEAPWRTVGPRPGPLAKRAFRRPSLCSMCMLKKCIPPKTMSTLPIFTESNSIAP